MLICSIIILAEQDTRLIKYTDVISLNQGERGILEFNYTYPGKYMFHAHKTEFSEKGWMGLFDVKDKGKNNNSAYNFQKTSNLSLSDTNNGYYNRAIENSKTSSKSQITNSMYHNIVYNQNTSLLKVGNPSNE